MHRPPSPISAPTTPSLALPSALTIALMIGLVALIPASAAIAAPAAVGVSMCLAWESQVRQARRSAETVRAPERVTAAAVPTSRPREASSTPLPVHGTGMPRWRPLSEVRAALLNIPPPTAIA